MSVTITKYPKRTRTDGVVSKWVAAHNPIVYELQRKDYEISAINNLAFTTIKVTLATPITSPDEVVVGDFIYIKSGTLYGGTYEVTSVISTTQIGLLKSFAGNSTGGYANLSSNRTGYQVTAQILAVQGTNYYILGTVVVTPDPTGLIKIDVHEWVKELLEYKNDFAYALINEKDTYLANNFNIRYIEEWDDHEEDITEVSVSQANRHYFVNAAKQISDELGQNMGLYVPSHLAPSTKAKWLSGFERPTLFKGYPFSLNFIYSELIAPYRIYRVTEQFDLNSNSLGAEDKDLLLVAGVFNVNRLTMPTLEATAKEISVYLEINTAVAATTGYAIDYASGYHEVEVISEPVPDDVL